MPESIAVVRFTLSLPAVFNKEDGWIVATFPDLDLASQGRTRKEAARNLIVAAQLFIEECFERGVLEAVLKGRGFAVASEAHPVPWGQQHLTVPLDLLAARNGSEAWGGCHGRCAGQPTHRRTLPRRPAELA